MVVQERRRRFTLGDGLILIAGVAASLALVKASAGDALSWTMFRDAFARPSGGWTLWHAFALTLEVSLLFGPPLAAGWTPACLLLQVVQPRPPWRRLRRQPGFVACLAATAIIVATLVTGTVVIASRPRAPDEWLDAVLKAQLLGTAVAGSGVLWSWVTMWLGRSGRPVPTWTDRLGRLTGVLWVVVGVMSVCYLGLTGL